MKPSLGKFLLLSVKFFQSQFRKTSKILPWKIVVSSASKALMMLLTHNKVWIKKCKKMDLIFLLVNIFPKDRMKLTLMVNKLLSVKTLPKVLIAIFSLRIFLPTSPKTRWRISSRDMEVLFQSNSELTHIFNKPHTNKVLSSTIMSSLLKLQLRI